MWKCLKMLSGCLIALVAVAPARSAQYLVTYDGVVTSGYDSTGVYGSASTSLVDEDVRVIYTLTFPKAGSEIYQDSVASFASGGIIFGNVSPLTASVTVKGISRSLDGQNFYGSSERYLKTEARAAEEISNYVYDFDLWGNTRQNYVYAHVYSYVGSILSSSSLIAPLFYLPSGDDIAVGQFQISDNGGGASDLASGVFSITSVSVAPAGVVPEPGAWALLVVGFGMIGSNLRRGQQRVGATYC